MDENLEKTFGGQIKVASIFDQWYENVYVIEVTLMVIYLKYISCCRVGPLPGDKQYCMKLKNDIVTCPEGDTHAES